MYNVTLLGILTQIEKGEIVLPAMQRPFVWKEDRIYKLMDSLLRGFPAGAIMLWKTNTLQRYRTIAKDIDTSVPQVFSYDESVQQDKHLVIDGQQRLTSLYIAFMGTYDHRSMYIDVLSGNSDGKDPGDIYFNCQFLTPSEAKGLNEEDDNEKNLFLPIKDLIKINPIRAATIAHKKALEQKLNDEEEARITDAHLRCATILGSSKSLNVILIDDEPDCTTPIEEILEIFVRVNSGGLILQKSDLLMSLLDLKWNDIQPKLQEIVNKINHSRPFGFSRDDVLKSLLLAVGSETRFNRLVSDHKLVADLAARMPTKLDAVQEAWERLGVILMDDCKIYSERFFRGGHISLMPFVQYLVNNPLVTGDEKRKIIVGIYLSTMSGVFSSAEARMAAFVRNQVSNKNEFPIKELAKITKRIYGIDNLDKLLRRHLDLTLNIAHGGITLDRNPDNLQRDHIFPKATLERMGYAYEQVYHYANFHFLRGSDNGNKQDKPPSEWFANPGSGAAYTDKDLAERLLSWNLIQPGNFETMLEIRGRKIREKAYELFKMDENQFNELFID